ncbi:MAG TPA: hypothetical protein VD837_01810 [Terriglobales bacterium]|nr:hypothetical protein [Terriglobales bacterium]
MRTRSVVLMLAALALSAAHVRAAEISVPKQVVAGKDLSVRTGGSGEATLILAGPSHVSRHQVRLGEQFMLKGEELRRAGRYIVVLEGGDASAAFFVTADAPSNVAFLAQPSRVPAARPDAVSGTAFVMDRYDNLVTAPTPVKFELAVPGTAAETRTTTSKDGVAWVRMPSGRREGPAQFTAAIGNVVATKRVVQQVATEPCNLRMRAKPSKNGILVETDPIRDCSGNAVPDGTIVTFTQVDGNGKSTVDARIKRGVARAELPPAERATISVASGVVVGNEIRWGGGR